LTCFTTLTCFTILSAMDQDDEPLWRKKQQEYEIKKARAKALKLRMSCTICGEKAKLNCPCGTTQYCSVECQRIDWRDRGHRKACKKIRDERAAEAARAEAPTPPPSPPVYGPAPRSHADEIRARIAAEHEAARARREANPEPVPTSERFGSRCPICLDEWDVNIPSALLVCCCRSLCQSCSKKSEKGACPLCREPVVVSNEEQLARLRRHVENDVPEAVLGLGHLYREGGQYGIVRNEKKAVKIFKRAAELGSMDAMHSLSIMYLHGQGVKVDMEKSWQLLRRAADGGQAQSQFSLASHFHRKGEHEEHIHYISLAAEQGLTDAMYYLGRCYAEGEGVEPDLDQAKIWYARAAAKGLEVAFAAEQLLDIEIAAAQGDESAVAALAEAAEQRIDIEDAAAKGNKGAIAALTHLKPGS